MISVAPQTPILGASDEFEAMVFDARVFEAVAESKIARRRCLNPGCFSGNVNLPVSGRLAVCASCDGAGEYGTAREARERYYRGRSTAMTLALQSVGMIDGDSEDHIGNTGINGLWPQRLAECVDR